jgi:hypothetical protein
MDADTILLHLDMRDVRMVGVTLTSELSCDHSVLPATGTSASVSWPASFITARDPAMCERLRMSWSRPSPQTVGALALQRALPTVAGAVPQRLVGATVHPAGVTSAPEA